MPTTTAAFTADMRVAAEEAFAPVVPITWFDDDEEAIVAASDTVFGLASCVYTRRDARIRHFLRDLYFGMVGADTLKLTGPHVPFGGLKQPGLGREGAHVDIQDYPETKYYCFGNLPADQFSAPFSRTAA